MRTYFVLLLGAVLGCVSIAPAPAPLLTSADAARIAIRFPTVRVQLATGDSSDKRQDVQSFSKFEDELNFQLTKAGFRLLGPEAAHTALDFEVKVVPLRYSLDSGVDAIYTLGDERGVVAKNDVTIALPPYGPGQDARAGAARLVADMLGQPDLAKLVGRPSASAVQIAKSDKSASRPKLAVLEFKDYAGLPKENVGYFADVVREALLKSAGSSIDLMTRENMLVLLQSSGKNLADCEGECEVDTGRKIGADAIVSGEIQKVGTNYKITLRLHETHDGRLLAATVASGHTIDELDQDTRRVAQDLSASLK